MAVATACATESLCHAGDASNAREIAKTFDSSLSSETEALLIPPSLGHSASHTVARETTNSRAPSFPCAATGDDGRRKGSEVCGPALAEEEGAEDDDDDDDDDGAARLDGNR